jgi:hypothetical protein
MAKLERSRNKEVSTFVLTEDLIRYIRGKCNKTPDIVKGAAKKAATDLIEAMFEKNDEIFEDRLLKFLQQYGKYLK